MATDPIWFYLDAERRQHGPVEAGQLAELVRSGALRPDSLIWRDGLADWAPLSELAAELGIAPAAAPAAPMPAPAAAPAPAPAETNAYAPPRAALQDEAPAGAIDASDVVPAGFLRRWVALFVDQMILSAVFYAVFFTLLVGAGATGALGGGGDALEQAMGGLMLLVYPLYLFFAAAYFVGFESSASQATPGKLLLGIKVVDLSGQRLAPGHALGRWAAAALSYLTLYIGFLMAAFTERKQALHDFVASTQVVDRWAYTAQPERQRRSPHGCVVAFVVVFVLIALLAVFAAISIPAYEDYLQRAGGVESGQAIDAPARDAMQARA